MSVAKDNLKLKQNKNNKIETNNEKEQPTLI